jgi:peroxiredoxin
LNVQNLGISVDHVFAQKTFAESLGLPYPLLSDYPDLRVIRRYGVVQQIGEASRERAHRSFFLIDKQGIIRGKWLAGNTEVFPSEPILKAARELAGM